MARRFAPRAALALTALAALGACANDPDLRVTAPPTSSAAPFMERYVSLGNSITAGYQSGGINDSTQSRSYAVLLAKAAGVSFTVPLLRRPGCLAPIANFLTGARVAPVAPQSAVPTGCYGRVDSTLGRPLNNVAVPGANSFDPLGLPGNAGNNLTALFLGGRTQVQSAIALDPTFATVWIGNNDVLSFAASGTTTGVTPVATFVSNYAATIKALRTGSPKPSKGVLIGVVDVTNVLLFVPAALFVPGSPIYSALAAATVSQGLFGGRAILPVNCPATTTAVIAVPVFQTLAAAAAALPAGQPVPLACSAITLPGVGTLGTVGVLDDTERAFFVSTVASYNTYIRAKADSIGFAYYDPNVAFLTLKANGSIPIFPNFAAPTQPFGPFISNDGVHPGTAAHLRLAQDLVALINTKYGSTIPAPTMNP